MVIDYSRIIVGFFILIFFTLGYFLKLDILILSLITIFVIIELYLSKFISKISDIIIIAFFIILFPLIYINNKIIFLINILFFLFVFINIFLPNFYFKKFFLLSVLIFVHNFFTFIYFDRNLLYLTIMVAFFNDTVAYISGRTLKGPLIVPSISPNKTWSGTTVSFIFTLFLIYQFDISILLACFLSISLFFGDIFFSYVKRNYNIKDFSNFLKGHGGFLDRLDSMFFFSVIINYIFL